MPSYLRDDETDELALANKGLYAFAKETYQELSPSAFLKDTSSLPSLTCPTAHHLIINLHTKEYLRPRAFSDAPHITSFYKNPNGVMKALYACLFYSWHSGPADVEELTQGRWAGDRLAIVHEDVVVEEFPHYEDISLEVKRLLRGLG
ncbi:hypothetical protein HDV00_002753 [Rhizophlyctis rosea]|nr:hypothetical protein HDV00_002753 [Rhizophlyctis rosea]